MEMLQEAKVEITSYKEELFAVRTDNTIA